MEPALPLAGRDILVTREEKAAKGMADIIRQYGGVPHIVPLISFKPFHDKKETTYLERLKSYEWIFFTSKNGVSFFFQKLEEQQLSLKGSQTRFAAVGEKTRQEMKLHGIEADFIPSLYTGADFAAEFLREYPDSGPVLLSKGNLARDTIAACFKDRGKHLDEWITYETCFPKDRAKCLSSLLQKREVSAVTFTSPSTVRRFVKIVNDHQLHDAVNGITVACIGPVTEEAALKNGLTVQVVPERYTVEDMMEGLARYFDTLDEE
ncbi:uroporphyrinogen-III synthase [Bacillus salacetis]|uniref:Uroporphyrinogen-III synthase n=1 Tax=Bacillus salacetis TaxID=2315464 RepID=A0A3A1R9S7_9BACI|nr:uroporphyrinogen-III synthase [Bacillus salacetis]RIW37720.1 uroporphyrinogen-III synthase [Bacillus salacetis]